MATKFILKKGSSRKIKTLSPKNAFLQAALNADLKETELKVIMYLESRKDTTGWTPVISIEQICERIKKGRTAVNDAIKALREKNLILESEKSYGGANKYNLEKY